jgi:hypothetical protein
MLFAFGSQTSWPTAEYLSQVRVSLQGNPRLRSFSAAIKDLPDLWNDLVAHDPRLQDVAGGDALHQLVAWLSGGNLHGSLTPPPNVLSMPFTVIIHMVQWFHFLDNNPNRAGLNQLLDGARAGGVQGFCIGILSAIAVASAQNEDDIVKSGGVALRLATCIGAYIDLDRLECDTTVLAVRWNSADSHNRLVSVISEFSNVRPIDSCCDRNNC